MAAGLEDAIARRVSAIASTGAPAEGLCIAGRDRPMGQCRNGRSELARERAYGLAVYPLLALEVVEGSNPRELLTGRTQPG